MMKEKFTTKALSVLRFTKFLVSFLSVLGVLSGKAFAQETAKISGIVKQIPPA